MRGPARAEGGEGGVEELLWEGIMQEEQEPASISQKLADEAVLGKE